MAGKLVSRPGKRDELVGLLMAAADHLKGTDGCELYLISRARDNPDAIWVMEAWRDQASHRASLGIAEIGAIIQRARPLIAEMEGVALEPVGGVI